MAKSRASQLVLVIEETTAERLGNAIKLLIDAGYTIKITDDGYCYIIEYDSSAYGTPLQWITEDQWVDEWIYEKDGKKTLLRSDLEDPTYCKDNGIVFFDDPDFPSFSYIDDLPGFDTAFDMYCKEAAEIGAMASKDVAEAAKEYEAQKPVPAVAVDKDGKQVLEPCVSYTDIPCKLSDQVRDLFFTQHIHNPGDESISTSTPTSKTATTKKKD